MVKDDIPLPEKTVFTTSEAAKICCCSPATIIKCFDDGTLKGYRVPRSRYRRIPRENLEVFMKDHGIPMDKLYGPVRDITTLVRADVQQALDDTGYLDALHLDTTMDLGMLARTLKGVVILDERLTGKEIYCSVATKLKEQGTKLKIIGIMELSENGSTKCLDSVISSSQSPQEIAIRIAQFVRGR